MQWVTKATQAAGDGHASGVFALRKVGGGKLQVAGSCGQSWGGLFTLREAGGGHCKWGWLEVASGQWMVHVARGGWWTWRVGGGGKLWVVGIASGWWVGGGHSEQVVVGSCGPWVCERGG